MKRIVVLVSGHGNNLQALIDACHGGHIAAKIVGVFSNTAHAYALKRAAVAGIAAHSIISNIYLERTVFDMVLADSIEQYHPDLVVLAGYMRILSRAFVQRYSGRILNIHPSLLPKYTGLYTHRRAIENGDSEHGASVHFVTEKLDAGPLIIQAKVPIFPGDTEDEVIARVSVQERILYPLAVQWFVSGRLTLREDIAWLDGERLPAKRYIAD